MKRRNVLHFLAISGLALCTLPVQAIAAESERKMPTVLETIKTRRSIRAFTPEAVSDADVKTLLEAAMQAPTAAGQQPWEFVLIRNKEALKKVGSINKYAFYAQKAPLGILICLNQDKEKIKGMGVLDVAMSAENLMLAATGLGLGSTFTGIYPEEDRIKGFQELCNLPPQIIPIGLIVIGHPQSPKEAASRFNESAIHQEKW